MQVHSYTVLHYGVDYLAYALRSVYDHVERLNVVYTPHPSHGQRGVLSPPESEASLRFAATAHDPAGKVDWRVTHHVWQEGPQRDLALELCRQGGADLALVVDCDEVWPEATLVAALEHAWRENKARQWLVNMTTLWRSFGWACMDNMWPVRIVDFRHADGIAYVPKELGPVYHFGYAVRDLIMQYKMSCHGHKAEWRPGWYEQKWSAWPPVADCHPTCAENTWEPQPFDRALLPEIMRGHPFYNLERID